MKLVVLGSGTSVPHPKRSSSGYWLETSGRKMLLDCSAHVPLRLAQEGLPWYEIDSIWISHFHLDHCGGLAPFLAGTKHAAQMKDRQNPLRIYGGPGLKKLINGFDRVHNYKLLEQPFPVEIVEIEPLQEFAIAEGVAAVAMKTPHTDESMAIHIRDGESTFVYTSDTGFEESVAAFANRVDLLLMECSFLENKPVTKHLELREAMFLTRRARPGRVVLTHLYPLWDHVDMVAAAVKWEPPCEVVEAVDGLVVEF